MTPTVQIGRLVFVLLLALAIIFLPALWGRSHPLEICAAPPPYTNPSSGPN